MADRETQDYLSKGIYGNKKQTPMKEINILVV